ncbi:Uncharacterized protein FWK35_00021472 [Aphis craccivora]|uniref:Uncharacterized protein n=1 Tax=Aphis craccivora TaxID=307492 RepID=A0A6G0YKM9_APHCR|nr:Uncharacterized protein FWK35_00021472 [Aphis craccivora]
MYETILSNSAEHITVALKVAFRFLITSRQLASQQKTTQRRHPLPWMRTTPERNSLSKILLPDHHHNDTKFHYLPPTYLYRSRCREILCVSLFRGAAIAASGRGSKRADRVREGLKCRIYAAVGLKEGRRLQEDVYTGSLRMTSTRGHQAAHCSKIALPPRTSCVREKGAPPPRSIQPDEPGPPSNPEKPTPDTLGRQHDCSLSSFWSATASEQVLSRIALVATNDDSLTERDTPLLLTSPLLLSGRTTRLVPFGRVVIVQRATNLHHHQTVVMETVRLRCSDALHLPCRSEFV